MRHLFANWLTVLGLCVAWPSLAASSLSLSEHQPLINPWSHVQVLQASNAPLLSVSQVAQLGDDAWWQPGYEPAFELGQKNLWLRLQLQASPDANRHWYLHLLNPQLENVDFYLLTGQTAVKLDSSGMARPLEHRRIQHRRIMLALDLNQPLDILIHVDSRLWPRLGMLLKHESIHQQQLANNDIRDSLGYGFFGSLLIVSLFLVVISREVGYLYFSAFVAFALVHIMSLDGFSYQYLWPSHLPWPAKLNHQITLAVIATGSLLCHQLLKGASPQWLMPLRPFYLISLLAALLIVTSPWLALQVTTWLEIILASVLLLMSTLISLARLPRGLGHGLFLAMGFLLILPGTLFLSAEVLGLINWQELGIQFFKWSLILGSAFFTLGMAWRLRELEEEKQRKILESQLKGQFLAQISHEIRNPVQAIVGLTDLVSRHPSPDNVTHIQSINQAAHSLLELVNDVLDQEKLNFGQVRLQFAPTNLDLLMRQICQLADIHRQEAVELLLDIDAGTQTLVMADQQRLSQVISNLLNNAFKFTEQGYVRLSLACRADHGDQLEVEFQIKDTGFGISESEQQLLFKPFSQTLLGQQQRHASSGLGLYISQQLVQLMGGQIAVFSRIGQGTQFSFSLVFNKSQMPLDAAIPSYKRLSPLLVWLAEDNEVNQQVLQAYLNLDKHRVSVFADAKSLLAAWQSGQKRPELLILDYNLPDMKADELIRQLKQLDPSYQGKIIGLSGEADSLVQQQCLAAGMSDYLIKPIRLNDLRRSIAQLATDA